MKRFVTKAILSMLSPAMLLGAFLLLHPSTTAAQDVKVIEMSAKKYEFSGSPIHIKKGTKVQLKVTSTDREHGVKLSVVADGAPSNSAPGLIVTCPQECVKVKKGETQTIEFVAQTPGTYSFKCCVDCGMGHHHMKGQIIVDE